MFSDFPSYLYAILIVVLIIMLASAVKSGHAVKSMLVSIVGGLGALCAVGVIGQFITLSVGVNFLTVIVAALLSVPGVVMLLLINSILL